MSDIDWDFWKRRVDVELWEAAFLSCDIDPDSQNYRDIRNCGMGNDKVSERLRLLRDNRHLRQFFSPGRIYIGDDNRNGVRLYEYARWCISNGTDIPGGLNKIAVETNIYELQEVVKQKEGRYTLQEAANQVEQKTGESADGVKIELVQAVMDGVLPVYEPGRKLKYSSMITSEYYEEAYWDDLNDWLEKNEPRIGCIFADPHAISSIEDEKSSNSTKSTRGRPIEINRKAAILQKLIKTILDGKEFNPKELSGSASNLLEACRKIEELTNPQGEKVFNTTEDTFKTWLYAAGYGFKVGRTKKEELHYWTRLCVETIGKIEKSLFT